MQDGGMKKGLMGVQILRTGNLCKGFKTKKFGDSKSKKRKERVCGEQRFCCDLTHQPEHFMLAVDGF